MSGLSFFDSNIVVYSDDGADPKKQSVAVRLIAEHHRSRTAVVSLQVMQEYFVAATKKLGVAQDVAQRKVELLSKFNVVRFSERDVVAAIELHRLTRLSFWDSMIVHAARVAEAQVLYSEDMQAGSTIAGVKIVNPFG